MKIHKNTVFRAVSVGRNFKKYLFAGILCLFVSLISIDNAHAQEGTSKQKQKKSRVKTDRNRKGEKAGRLNRRQRWIINSNKRKQGERASKRGVGGRKVQTRVTQSRPTPSRRAEPKPYAGRKRKTEQSIARKAAKRQVAPPVSASRGGERAFNKTISGRRIKTRQTSSARSKPPKRAVNPYKYTKRRTEQDVAKRAARRQVAPPRSSSAKGERAGSWSGGGGRILSGKGKSSSGRPSHQKNPYASGKASSLGVPRRGLGGKRMPMSVSKSGEDKKVRTKKPYRFRKATAWERGRKGDISGRPLRKNFTPPRPTPGGSKFNPYYGRKKGGERGYSGNIRPGVRSASKQGESKPGRGASVAGRSATRQAETNPGRGRNIASGRSASGLNRGGRRLSASPYAGRKMRGNDKPYMGNVRPRGRSASQASESRPGKGRNIASGRSASGLNRGGRRLSASPYAGRKMRGNDKPYMGNVRPRGKSASQASESKPGKGRNIASGRSASGAYMSGANRKTAVGRSISGANRGGRSLAFNPYAGRKKGPGDKAYKGRINPNVKSATKSAESKPGSSKNDAIGRTITGANRRGRTTINPYAGRKMKGGDKAYKGSIKPRNKSATVAAESKRQSEKNVASGRTITGQRKPSQLLYSPYAGRKRKGGDVPYEGIIKPNNRTATLPAERKRKPDPYLGSEKNSITGKYSASGKKIPQKKQSTEGKRSSQFQGNMKARKQKKGGGSLARNNWNNDGEPVDKQVQSPENRRAMSFSGYGKAEKRKVNYESMDRGNWNNDGKSINRREIQQDNYMNYSGSIKVVKRKGKGYHPSYYFHGEKNNSLTEKEKKLSFKLLISRIFRTNQPKNLREKPGKLEFDKKEQGLWYE